MWRPGTVEISIGAMHLGFSSQPSQTPTSWRELYDSAAVVDLIFVGEIQSRMTAAVSVSPVLSKIKV